MATLDDLPLDDDRDGTQLDRQRTVDAQRFLERLDDLIENDAYAWAADTLSGIRETVERSGRASDRQREAVANIVRGHERQEEERERWDRYGRERRSRRYD